MVEEPAGKSGSKKFLRMAEAIALMSVIIAGLGLFLSYSQWSDSRKERREAQQQDQQRAQVRSALVLRGEGRGGQIRLQPVRDDQVVQSVVFYFPSAIHAGPVRITGAGHLDAGWFADGLKAALKGADDKGSDHELPVGVETVYVEDGDSRTDRSIYEVAFSIHKRMLQSAEVGLEGLALSRRGVGGGLQGAVDAAWARQSPSLPPT